MIVYIRDLLKFNKARGVLRSVHPCQLERPQKCKRLCNKSLKATRVCTDYVIDHEMFHLKHHNHSEGFYKLLKRELPDWKAVKERLDYLVEQILV
jgi:predicted metal-dependent hydrolase